MKVIIIGAVAAGTSAATEIRRHDKKTEIIIYEKERYISYSGCGMPYYIGNITTHFEDIVPRDANFFKQKHNVNIQIMHEVLSIDSNTKTITVKSLLSGQIFQDSYDKLILATGAATEKSSFPGGKKKHVFQLRNVNDMKSIKTFLSINTPKTAAIIGSGAIGLEMAENFTRLGIKTKLIARSPMGKGMPEEFGARIKNHMIEKGVSIIAPAKIKEISDRGVVLEDGTLHPAEIVLMATGVKPATELAASAGIRIGQTGAIQINPYMQTSNPDIFACGDCAEYFHRMSGRPTYKPLGSTANKTGIIAGNRIVGGSDQFLGVLGTNIVKVFDLTIAQTGLSVSEAQAEGFDPVVSLDQKPNKPEFMGGEMMMIYAIADKNSGRLLGCQMIGGEGVDRRIDVFAALLTKEGTYEDLITADLAYAPPYSTPKDPLFFTGIKLRQAMIGNAI